MVITVIDVGNGLVRRLRNSPYRSVSAVRGENCAGQEISSLSTAIRFAGFAVDKGGAFVLWKVAEVICSADCRTHDNSFLSNRWPVCCAGNSGWYDI